MDAPELKRLKSLKEDNARLMNLLAKTIMGEDALQVALGRKY